MTGGATVERTPTVISGFDDIALGGLPTGRSTLVTGTTGSGKTLFAAEYNHITRQGIEEFVFDNVMILRNVMQNERRRRTIEIVKFRGTTHRTGEWLFTIDPKDGLVIIPIAFLVPRDRASQERVSTGNIELDAMVGGGVFRDAVVLLIGPSGGGKTLSAPQFADAAFRAGERCLFHAFDETREQLSRNAAGWGLDLDVMEASGLLRVPATYPEVASVEDHFLRIRRDIADFAPARLIIDSLSALERRAAPRTLLDFVIALGGVVLQHEIMAFSPPHRWARGHRCSQHRSRRSPASPT